MTHLWYASYGSNLLAARFLTYLTGGPIPGSSNGRVQDGARDPTPPSDDRRVEIDRTLLFARSSPQWGGGGVAFLDPDQRPATATRGRAWRITLPQLADVYRQENGITEVVDIDLDRLLEIGHLDLVERWYGRLIHLGHLDGESLVTFTAAVRPDDTNRPHPRYLEVMASGLAESWDMDRRAADTYLASVPQAPRSADDPRPYTANSAESASTGAAWNPPLPGAIGSTGASSRFGPLPTSSTYASRVSSSTSGDLMIDPIVTVDWLTDHRDDVTVCDVRYYLDGRSGPAAFEAGHLPGAVYIDMDTVLASPAGPIVGRHPMPTPEVFASGLGRAGVADHATVVVYDDLSGMVAGRLVWMLRIIGQPAALLDGGFTSWTGDIETGRGARPIPVSRSVVEWPRNAMASADEVAAAIEAGVVVADSRAGDRYRGEIEPIDAKAGHVPGAISLPFSVNLDQGRFRPVDELRRRFDEAGIDGDGIVYCGSGVSACNNLLAIEATGLGRPRLYVGSWSGWSSDPDRPVATTEQ